MYIKGVLRNFAHYQTLLKELVIRDIKVKYKRSVLGILWTILNPLLNMVVLSIVFSNFFRYEIDNYPLYYLTGSILFSFCTEGTTQAMGSVAGNANLIKKVYIPKYLFPVSKVMSSVVNLGFALLALILMMVFSRAEFHPVMFMVIPFLPTLILFVMGLSLLLSCVAVFFKDIIYLYGIFTTLWSFLTPIFYPTNILPENVMEIVRLNPMYLYISYFRSLCLDHVIPPAQDYLYCAIFGIITFAIGIWVFYKKQDRFVLYI